MRCSRCAGPLDVDSNYIEIPNYGIYCEPCAEALAEEGLALAREHSLMIGNSAVDARMQMLRQDQVSRPN